jgi:hypothetical protein
VGCLYQIEFPSGKKYIGISKHDADKRCVAHFVGAKNNGKLIVHNAIRKYGAEKCKVSTLVISNNIEYLKELEIKAIAALNTKSPNGYNCTRGGDGVVELSEEAEKIRVSNMKETMATEEYKQRVSEIQKAVWTEERKENRRKQTLKLWQKPSYRKKNTKPRGATILSPDKLEEKKVKLRAAWMDEEKRALRTEKMKLWYVSLTEEQKKELNKKRSEARVGKKRKPESIEKMRIAQKKRFEDPEERKKLSERTKKQMQDPQQRAKIARTLKKRNIADLWAKDKHRERMLYYYSDPENRKAVSERSKKQFSDPEQRKKQSEIKIKYWSDPENRKKNERNKEKTS